VVKGFPRNVMPSFQGKLNEDEVTALIEYIKSAK
jgi:cytochrome c oxidase subunit 2